MDVYLNPGLSVYLLNQQDYQHAGCMVVNEQLPGISGIELLEKLNAYGCPATTIILNDNSSIKSTVRAIRAIASDYFEKPVSEYFLTNTILTLSTGPATCFTLTGPPTKI